MKFKNFLKVCHEKEVFKKLSLYVVFSWVLLQVISLISDAIGLSKNVLTYSLIILLIGLPTYIFYVWKTYLKNIKPVATNDTIADQNEKNPRNTLSFQTYYFISLGMISFVIGSLVVFVYIFKFGNEVVTEEIELQDKIAVLKFGNKTGSKDFDMIGDMAADWIIHGISHYQIAQVITPDTYEEFTQIFKASVIPIQKNQALQEYFNPKQIITGNYFLKEDQLIFQGSVIDGKTNTLLYSFESVECNSKNPLDCIELLKQKILGFLVTDKNPELNLQETPPNFEAYKKVLQAKANIAENNTYINLLNQAIEIDSNYLQPHFLRIEFFYNRKNYVKSDSLLQAFKKSFILNSRQKNLVNYYQALLAGNNKMIFRYFKKEYNYAPFDIHNNLSAMVFALEFVNHPDEVEPIYEEINSDNLDLENCTYCEFRNYIQAMAFLELKQYDKTIDLLQEIVEISDRLTLKKALIAAHIKLENYEIADEVISNFESKMELKNWLNLCLYSGTMLLIEKKDSLAKKLFDKVILKSDPELDEHEFFRAQAFYYSEDYTTSESLFERLVLKYPENIEYNVLLAISYQKNGKAVKAEEALGTLEKLRTNFQYGTVDYAFGQYYASINDEGNVRKFLLKSAASGHWYANYTFQNDPHFKNIKSENYFKEIMNFWH